MTTTVLYDDVDSGYDDSVVVGRADQEMLSVVPTVVGVDSANSVVAEVLSIDSASDIFVEEEGETRKGDSKVENIHRIKNQGLEKINRLLIYEMGRRGSWA